MNSIKNLKLIIKINKIKNELNRKWIKSKIKINKINEFNKKSEINN